MQIGALRCYAVFGNADAIAEHIVLAAPINAFSRVLHGDKAVERIVGIGRRAVRVRKRSQVAVTVVGDGRHGVRPS